MTMKLNNNTLTILLLLIVLMAFSCDDDIPDYCPNPALSSCPDYDPCWNIKAANADFIIFDTFYMDYVDDFSVELDTAFNGNRIHFRAKNKNATYEWQVGADPEIHTGQYFELFFPSEFTGDIAVRLVTTQESNDCLMEEELRDTIVKSFYLLNKEPSNLIIAGRFKGVKSTTPEDSILVEIVPGGVSPPVQGIIGLFNNCSQWPSVLFIVHNQIFFESSPYEITCEGPVGNGWLHEDRNTIEIHYTVNLGFEADYERSDTIKFVGRRVE